MRTQASERNPAEVIAMGLVLIAIFAAAYFTRYILLASLVGIGLGVIISPLMKILKLRMGIPRGISAVLVFMAVIGGLVGLGYALVHLVSDQVTALIQNSPQIIATVKDQALAISTRHEWVMKQIQDLNIASMGQVVVRKVFQGLGAGTIAIGGSAIVLLIGLYVAINSSAYFHSLLSVFPAYLRPKASSVLIESGVVLRKWFRAQLIVMSITGSATTLGLWIIGIDYWLLFGVMTALLGIIPYVGVILTVILTSLVTLGSDAEKIYWVLGLFFIIQQLEGNVLIPLIMRENVDLPEAHLVILMIILGSWFGILGAFIAPPLMAVGLVVYRLTYAPAMDAKTMGPSPETVSSQS
jgi:predicted PurR-regulated permease PerM